MSKLKGLSLTALAASLVAGALTYVPNVAATSRECVESEATVCVIEADDLATVESGKNYVLTADVTANVRVEDGVTADLDLNGYTLTGAGGSSTPAIYNAGTLAVKDSGDSGKVVGAANGYYTVLNQGVMAISGGTYSGLTQITATGGPSLIANGWYSNAPEGAQASLTINGGTFLGGLETVKNQEAGNLTINGGTFDKNGVSNGFLLQHSGYTFDINGGTFNGKSVLDNKAPGENRTVNINGGTFSYNATSSAYGVFLVEGTAEDAGLTINFGGSTEIVAGGLVPAVNYQSADRVANGLYKAGNYTVNVNGGTYKGNFTVNETNGGKLNLNAGSITAAITKKSDALTLGEGIYISALTVNGVSPDELTTISKGTYGTVTGKNFEVTGTAKVGTLKTASSAYALVTGGVIDELAPGTKAKVESADAVVDVKGGVIGNVIAATVKVSSEKTQGGTYDNGGTVNIYSGARITGTLKVPTEDEMWWYTNSKGVTSKREYAGKINVFGGLFAEWPGEFVEEEDNQIYAAKEEGYEYEVLPGAKEVTADGDSVSVYSEEEIENADHLVIEPEEVTAELLKQDENLKVVYDIHFEDDQGNEVGVKDGRLRVEILVRKESIGDYQYFQVVYIDDEGVMREFIDVDNAQVITLDDEEYYAIDFTITHLSSYGILAANTPFTSADERNEATTAVAVATADTPDTGMMTGVDGGAKTAGVVMAAVLGGAMGGLMGAFYFVRKKKEVNA